jgi:DNA-binding transcriptional LysR family regulator
VKRRVALVTPHFMAALAAVSGTDMATTVGRSFASRFAAPLGLVLKEPPLPRTDLDMTIVWNEVLAADPVLIWMRKVIGEVARETMASAPVRVSRVRERA